MHSAAQPSERERDRCSRMWLIFDGVAQRPLKGTGGLGGAVDGLITEILGGSRHRGLINPSFHLGGGAGAKSTPQTGLRHISNRSRVCRNGNWKMASGDWRRKATSPEAKFQNLPARHSGAPA